MIIPTKTYSYSKPGIREFGFPSFSSFYSIRQKIKITEITKIPSSNLKENMNQL